MLAGTGSPRNDVENDFLRARRHQALARLAGRLRGEPARRSLVRTLGDATDELGWRGQVYRGLQTIRLDTIAGSASSRRDLTAASGPPRT
jgi:hypothetical protein